MNQIGTDIRTYFEATTEPVKIEEIFDPGVVIVGPGGSRSERDDTMLTQERPTQTPPSRFRGPRIAAAAAIAAIVVAIGVFALGGGNDESQVVTTDPQVTIPPTTVAPTTVPPTTAAVTETPAVSDPATQTVDRLIEVYNAQDVAGLDEFFGDSVAFNTQSGIEGVGTEVSEGWQQVFGSTLVRETEGYETADGLFVFLVDSIPPAGRNDLSVYEVEMDGDRLVRLNNRIFTAEERSAMAAVDELFEAFNDQDAAALSAIFGEDVVYTSPSNVEFVGQQAATYWQRFFGETAVRTTGVFDLGGGTFGFDIDFIEPDSDRATHRTALIEVVDGRISSFVED